MFEKRKEYPGLQLSDKEILVSQHQLPHEVSRVGPWRSIPALRLLGPLIFSGTRTQQETTQLQIQLKWIVENQSTQVGNLVFYTLWRILLIFQFLVLESIKGENIGEFSGGVNATSQIMSHF